MIEPTGYTALDLIGFTDRGAYDPTANYVKNDIVTVSNTKWRCKIDDTTGITPTEGANWTIFIKSATRLAGMDDVTLASPKNGDGLVHDGNDWTNIPIMTKEQWQENGAYNDLPMTLTSQVINGATATINADGSVTIDTAGSATTGVANFVWQFPSFGKVGKKYRLVGCPSGGGANTYYVNIYDGGWNDGTKDYGSGNTFTLSTGITEAVISIRSGVVVDHLTFKPMITTDLNATYDDFVEYAKTNRELTESAIFGNLTRITSPSVTLTMADATKTVNITKPYKMYLFVLAYNGSYKSTLLFPNDLNYYIDGNPNNSNYNSTVKASINSTNDTATINLVQITGWTTAICDIYGIS